MVAPDNTINVKWSKREDDILYSWGKGIPKADTWFIHSVFDYKLINELEKRGYDITTLKFSIMKRSIRK